MRVILLRLLGGLLLAAIVLVSSGRFLSRPAGVALGAFEEAPLPREAYRADVAERARQVGEHVEGADGLNWRADEAFGDGDGEGPG